MSFTPADLPDLTGVRAIVTGSNAGIGEVTARELAARGAEVTLACRNTDAATEAARAIPGTTHVEQLDLASLDSVRDFAERWDGPLDLLVNNAGVMTPPSYRETADGHELMFGTNHLGHFALTGRLLPALLEAEAPRVVTVASIAHHRGDARVLDANPPEGYAAERYYGNSKLANVLFSRELHRRATASGSKVVSTAAHPGISATNLVASRDGMGANRLIHLTAPYFMPVLFQSAAKGANPTLYAATLGEPGSYTGPQRMRESRGPIGPARPSRQARDEQLAADLWALSEEKTGVSFAL
ncbi:SDR family NAD(P)-dependent oxidoreductase [Nocardioides cavernaquae]|uniref:SDR family NAD(P)-dependent oxidoreductase n=1 Tax=Nocardioides cavernaquae TaxID=2321396 RepID=A0A3A5HCU5_9ACTN|nr:SDR family NAD(P)-dependent oxidoreductase [Nocardioides cavernaquae]RJS45834.1 SDR family NAD(P)-dependent oxidoreductase [Nocardioides cavernaquae]